MSRWRASGKVGQTLWVQVTSQAILQFIFCHGFGFRWSWVNLWAARIPSCFNLFASIMACQWSSLMSPSGVWQFRIHFSKWGKSEMNHNLRVWSQGCSALGFSSVTPNLVHIDRFQEAPSVTTASTRRLHFSRRIVASKTNFVNSSAFAFPFDKKQAIGWTHLPLNGWKVCCFFCQHLECLRLEPKTATVISEQAFIHPLGSVPIPGWPLAFGGIKTCFHSFLLGWSIFDWANFWWKIHKSYRDSPYFNFRVLQQTQLMGNCSFVTKQHDQVSEVLLEISLSLLFAGWTSSIWSQIRTFSWRLSVSDLRLVIWGIFVQQDWHSTRSESRSFSWIWMKYSAETSWLNWCPRFLPL